MASLASVLMRPSSGKLTLSIAVSIGAFVAWWVLAVTLVMLFHGLHKV